ncbi:MAG: restriction endonuclease subunit S [Ruminococcaceae bacterium]|nr:restriction endonuclease subunit S [Oscillospiraceae bacterium]
MVKQGYKQTEIGVIPEDWEIYPLQKISEINPCSDCKMLQEFFYIDLESVVGGILVNKKLINKADAPSRAQRYFKRNDILYQTVRPYQQNNLFVDFDSKQYIASTGYAIIRSLKNKSVSKYLYHYLHTDDFLSVVLDNCTGTSYPAINPATLSNIKIKIPINIEEQNLIAEALSDVDSMISSLEKLIAKKKAIKQGATQELLTGEKRLPGFDGDWKPIQLGSVSKIKTGDKNNEQKTDDGKYPFFVRSQQVERINSYSYDGEAILIPGEGNIGQIFHYINGKFDWHQRVYKISDFSEFVCGKYVYYQMKFSFGEHALKNTVKATVDSLRLPTFEQFEFLIPPIVEEQTAIASILSDMDNEIEALDQKLAKTRQIKQGMMQQLLTGKIRLV